MLEIFAADKLEREVVCVGLMCILPEWQLAAYEIRLGVSKKKCEEAMWKRSKLFSQKPKKPLNNQELNQCLVREPESHCLYKLLILK